MSDDKIIKLFPDKDGVTFEKIDPKQVISKSLEAGLNEVLIIGWSDDGMFYLSSSEGYTPDLITMCELAKQFFLSGYDQ